MTALRMDGTARPRRSTEITPAKLAREWFKAHPICVIIFHWRESDLDGVSREMLHSKRTATVAGNRVKFDVALSGGLQRSEMSLDGLTSADISTGNLQVEFGSGHHIEYTPVSGA